MAEERLAMAAFIRNNPLLSRFFDLFLFEELPASDRHADTVYLDEVEQASVYIGLFGNEYGFEDSEGISPTEHEFDRATATGKPRIIFVKGNDDKACHPKMRLLIKRAGQQVIRKRFVSIPELTSALNSSLVDYLEVCGIIQDRPFEERPCPDATPGDIDAQSVLDFVRLARSERQFPLSLETPANDVLAHLHLLCDNHPTNAAILLFGRDPQRFLPAAEVRCMHFHGTEIQRPVPFYRIFKGTLFEQVDKAVDFVMSKINRSVGTRAESIQAPVRYEIPPDVIREAVVNAIVHRNYTSTRDLNALKEKGLIEQIGIRGPGVHYVLAKKGDIMRTMET